MFVQRLEYRCSEQILLGCVEPEDLCFRNFGAPRNGRRRRTRIAGQFELFGSSFEDAVRNFL